MKRLITILMLVALYPFVGSTSLVNAQTKYGQAGMPFLKIDVGGRAALAGTQLGVNGDAFSVFANPAGLAQVQGLDARISLTNWIADIKHNAGAAAYNLGNLGTFAVSFIQMDYGDDIQGTVPSPIAAGYVKTEMLEVKESVIGIAYGRAISSQFFVGGQLKYASQDLGVIDVVNELTEDTSAVAQEVTNIIADFGTIYYPGFKDLRFGMSLRNFSNQNDYYDARFELPLTFDFGIAMDILSLTAMEGGTNKLTLALDWTHPRDFKERLHIGIEYALMDMLFLRGGYKFNYDEESLTAGVGIQKDFGGLGVTADFIYTNFGIFDTVTRMTVGVTLK